MKRPGPIVFAFGNPVSVTVLAIIAAYLVYEWWRGEIPPAGAVVAFFAAAYAGHANKTYERYRVWKREWEIMEGRASASASSRALARGGPLRIALGLAVLGAWGYFAITDANAPGMQIPVDGFWLATLALAVAGIYRLVRWRKSHRQIASRDVAVTVCLGIPRQSPRASDTVPMLPQYCSLIFQRLRSNSPNQS
jgi:hypothetical protein